VERLDLICNRSTVFALSRTEAQRKISTPMNESSLRCQLVNVTCSSCRDCRSHTGFKRTPMIARDNLGSASFLHVRDRSAMYCSSRHCLFCGVTESHLQLCLAPVVATHVTVIIRACFLFENREKDISPCGIFSIATTKLSFSKEI
jgi:hypothetical protein